MDETQLKILSAELIRDEGEVLHAYQDSAGFWTIGVGVLIDARRGGGITQEESRYLLGNRIASKEEDLDAKLPWWRHLSPVRRRVLLNMAYNLGVGDSAKGLLSFRDTLAAIRAGRFEDAARGMEDSKWARQVGTRADRLAEMMRKG